MHNKANALIEQVNVVNAEVIRAAEACSDEQWQMGVVEEDGRSVSVVFHHIGIAYPFAISWAGMIAKGEPLPSMTRDELDGFNAHHAQEQASTSQADVVAYLKEVTQETAVSLQAFSDEQLERVGAIAMAGGKEFSGEWIVQMFAIGHAQNHLKVIKTTIGMES